MKGDWFHLADNSQYISKGQPGHDPLFKLRSLSPTSSRRTHRNPCIKFSHLL